MEKAYKVAYKVHLYERLRKVNFHGKFTYPLYIQVTFDRKSIIFKSYYFELFAKPRYGKVFQGRVYGPKIKDIMEAEHELIEFIIDKNKEEFSLELFKKEYDFYSRDLCDLTEEGFSDYLHIFFNDEGLSGFAKIVKKATMLGIVNDVMDDMKSALKENIYNKLIENSFYYAPPYLPLNSFVQQTKEWPLRYFSIMEWNNVDVKNAFMANTSKLYRSDNRLIESEINRLVGTPMTENINEVKS